MDRVLKGLQGKTVTKKGLFDFLADIDLEVLTGKKENTAPLPPQVIVDNPLIAALATKEPEKLKCDACDKTFTAITALRRHYKRFPECVAWNNRPDRAVMFDPPKGIHLYVDDLVDKVISNEDPCVCKYCDSRQTTPGNLRRHFNTAKICNRMAFIEFCKLINSLLADT